MSRYLATILNQQIIQNDDLSFSYLGDLDIDADGAPNAYAPAGSGLIALDVLSDAQDARGRWCGVVVDGMGNPIVAPSGYYISTTSLQNFDYLLSDSRRYVDATKVAYSVINEELAQLCTGIVLGCKCLVEDTHSGQQIWTVVADVGPTRRLGEISMFAAQLLGFPDSPIDGGCQEMRFRYTVFPNQVTPGYSLQPL